MDEMAPARALRHQPSEASTGSRPRSRGGHAPGSGSNPQAHHRQRLCDGGRADRESGPNPPTGGRIRDDGGG